MKIREIFSRIHKVSGLKLGLGFFSLLAIVSLVVHFTSTTPVVGTHDSLTFPKNTEAIKITKREDISANISDSYVGNYSGGYSYSWSSSSSSTTFWYPTIVSTMQADPGYSVLQYMKMLYAHSNGPFGYSFKSLGVGSRFTVVNGDGEQTYEIVSRQVYEKDYLNSQKYLRLSIYQAKGHDISLMTCGNGYNDDSDYRLVLLADRV